MRKQNHSGLTVDAYVMGSQSPPVNVSGWWRDCGEGTGGMGETVGDGKALRAEAVEKRSVSKNCVQMGMRDPGTLRSGALGT